MNEVMTGLSALAHGYERIPRGTRCALITNATGVDDQLNDTLSVLLSLGLDVRKLFSPEHGIHQIEQAGESVTDDTEPRYGVPIISIYGKDKKPKSRDLDGIDLLIYDIQDVGARFFTYISAMLLAMQAAAENGVGFAVLDRPNPITGELFSGPVLDDELISYVGAYRLPIAYGLTAGELAALYAGETGLDIDLRVVRMRGWKRKMWWENTGLPWINPSPNMPSPLTALLYPGTCLIEGTNLSEGRGTTRPFELIGAPWVDPYRLAGNAPSSEFVKYRPCYFKPVFSKYAEQTCGGVQMHVIRREGFDPVSEVLRLLDRMKSLYPDRLKFNDHFDRLCGDLRVRKRLEAGKFDPALFGEWEVEISEYRRRIRPCLIY